jgi:hypothetical protein
MHWGWHWKVKLKHQPKKLCSQLLSIDSFDLLKKSLIQQFLNKTILEIPSNNLSVTFFSDHLLVDFINNILGSYRILLEEKSCNYGGSYYFFHCPCCQRRMRKLYLVEGKFICRKCANLGYYSQRMRSSDRCLLMGIKTKKFLEDKAGSLNQKPPWMKKHTFQKLINKYANYDAKFFSELREELVSWYGDEFLF